MNGLWRCANYAFAPNFFKYCGPDKNQELKGYLQTKTSDKGLKVLLNDFSALHPYLQLIAQSNGIADEFDERVVDAYWLGNRLLENVSMRSFFDHVKSKLKIKERNWFEQKLPQGAKPNHQFHVFNFITRTGHRQIPHTVETMDQCRISWGKVLPGGKVATQKLIYQRGRLNLAPAVKEYKNLTEEFKPSDLVTLHWGWVCEKFFPQQVKKLTKYTNLALSLANQTI